MSKMGQCKSYLTMSKMRGGGHFWTMSKIKTIFFLMDSLSGVVKRSCAQMSVVSMNILDISLTCRKGWLKKTDSPSMSPTEFLLVSMSDIWSKSHRHHHHHHHHLGEDGVERPGEDHDHHHDDQGGPGAHPARGDKTVVDRVLLHCSLSPVFAARCHQGPGERQKQHLKCTRVNVVLTRVSTYHKLVFFLLWHNPLSTSLYIGLKGSVGSQIDEIQITKKI